jgi:hypothetical protein
MEIIERKDLKEMMEISIRRATKADAGSIYELLACESMGHRIESIEGSVCEYSVLQIDSKIVAVFYEHKDCKDNVFAIHPGYPEKIIVESVRGLISAAKQRKSALNSKLHYLNGTVKTAEKLHSQKLSGRIYT